MLVIDNAIVYYSPLLQQMCNEDGAILVYLPTSPPDYDSTEQ